MMIVLFLACAFPVRLHIALCLITSAGEQDGPDPVELVDQYTCRLDREFDGTPSMTIVARKSDPADISLPVSQIIIDNRLKSKLKLSSDQLSRAKRVLADLESTTQKVIQDEMVKSKLKSAGDLHHRVRKRIEQTQRESNKQLAAVWSPLQEKQLGTVAKRSRLLALGWELVLEELDEKDGLALTTTQRQQFTALLDRWRKEIPKRRQDEQSEAIRRIMEIIGPEQKAILVQWLRQTDDDVPVAALPCIEVWLAQLETAANSNFDTSQDPFDALRIELQPTMTGGLHVQRQFRCIAMELANSCLKDDLMEMVPTQFEDLVQAIRDPQSAIGAELAECDREMDSIKRRMLTSELDLDQAGKEMGKIFLRKDQITWQGLHELLIPSQAEQLDRVLAEFEFQNVGICASLLYGTLGKKIGMTKAEAPNFRLKEFAGNWLSKNTGPKQGVPAWGAINAFAQKEASRVEELGRQWEIEVTSQIESILTRRQKTFLRNEFAAFDPDAILAGNPELLFATRNVLKQSND